MKLIETWNEWGKVYARLDFWREEIEAICEANGVRARAIDSTFPGTHAVFFVNDDTVLKIYCPVRYNTYRKELRLHTGPLRAPLYPQIRYHGKSPSGYDYIAFTRFHGTPVREITREAIPDSAIHALAQAIATLQSATLGFPQSAIRNPHSAIKCLVHYDLTEDHVFLDDEGRLEGIIDFGDAKMGHPSDELPALFAACLSCDDRLIAAFRTAYDDASTHYRIDDDDLVDALNRHTYRRDIIECVRRAGSECARGLLERI